MCDLQISDCMIARSHDCMIARLHDRMIARLQDRTIARSHDLLNFECFNRNGV